MPDTLYDPEVAFDDPVIQSASAEYLRRRRENALNDPLIAAASNEYQRRQSESSPWQQPDYSPEPARTPDPPPFDPPPVQNFEEEYARAAEEWSKREKQEREARAKAAGEAVVAEMRRRRGDHKPASESEAGDIGSAENRARRIAELEVLDPRHNVGRTYGVYDKKAYQDKQAEQFRVEERISLNKRDHPVEEHPYLNELYQVGRGIGYTAVGLVARGGEIAGLIEPGTRQNMSRIESAENEALDSRLDQLGIDSKSHRRVRGAVQNVGETLLSGGAAAPFVFGAKGMDQAIVAADEAGLTGADRAGYITAEAGINALMGAVGAKLAGGPQSASTWRQMLTHQAREMARAYPQMLVGDALSRVNAKLAGVDPNARITLDEIEEMVASGALNAAGGALAGVRKPKRETTAPDAPQPGENASSKNAPSEFELPPADAPNLRLAPETRLSEAEAAALQNLPKKTIDPEPLRLPWEQPAAEIPRATRLDVETVAPPRRAELLPDFMPREAEPSRPKANDESAQPKRESQPRENLPLDEQTSPRAAEELSPRAKMLEEEQARARMLEEEETRAKIAEEEPPRAQEFEEDPANRRELPPETEEGPATRADDFPGTRADAEPPVFEQIVDKAFEGDAESRQRWREGLSDDAESSRAQIRNRDAGLADPRNLADFAIIGAEKLAKGAGNFDEWSQQMREERGPGIEPHLPELWQQSQAHLDASLQAPTAAKASFLDASFETELPPILRVESPGAKKGAGKKVHLPASPEGMRKPPKKKRGGASSEASLGSHYHADKPGRLPDQFRRRFAETEVRITPPGKPGQDVWIIGGKHPSDYPGSTWPPGVNAGDFKPDTKGGRKTFRSDQKRKWKQKTHMLPYDPATGSLR